MPLTGALTLKYKRIKDGAAMAVTKLPELVEAIASAVIEAQDQIDVHQLSLLQRYFDENDRPKSATMVVPSLSHDDDGDVRYNIPWLALMRPNLLSIKEVEVDFEVEFTQFHVPEGTTRGASDDESAEETTSPSSDEKVNLPHPPAGGEMMVDIGAPKTKKNGATAKVTIKVAGQEPTEGLARLINELVKRIMIVSHAS
jgi:hypothetical protein